MSLPARTEMAFTKYEGLGNDFILVESPLPVEPMLVRALCDRHLGIGADGVLSVWPRAQVAASPRMVVTNADGSRPEMCGNGLRCAALHWALRKGAGRSPFSVAVQTDAGDLSCEVLVQQGLGRVRTALGRGCLMGSHHFEDYVFQLVSTGNPHAVFFGELPSLAEIDRVGAAVCAQVSGGTNVEFVHRMTPTHLQVVVWERGVGRTLACGTGAAASAVAAVATGHAAPDVALRVVLPGGELRVEVVSDTWDIALTGPARKVFAGTVDVGAESWVGGFQD